MKRFIVALILLITLGAKAQEDSTGFGIKAIVPAYSLDITWHKTTLLIFPAAIQSADRGDRYVLAEKVKGVENILKVKAGEKDFQPSNLQVVTADGKVYVFNVYYSELPSYNTIDLRQQTPLGAVLFEGVSLNGSELSEYADLIAGSEPFVKGVKYRNHGMTLTLDGIYIKDDVLFFRYRLKNKTPISYSGASLRFYIRDKKKAKRTAVQDREIQHLHLMYTGRPEDKQGQTIVVALKKFTIAESKDFVSEFIEEGGGDRHFTCKVGQGKLFKAKPLRKL